MESRFGFKDLVITVLLLAILVSIWLAMAQFDRQWDDVQALGSQMRQLTQEQTRVRNQINEMWSTLEQGVRVAPGNGGAGAAAADPDLPQPFERIENARSQPSFAEGDWLIDAFGTNVASITALTYKDLYGRRIQGYILESLISRDPDTLEWIPLIARSWQIDDNSKAYWAWRNERETQLRQAADAEPDVWAAQLRHLEGMVEEAGGEAPAAGTPEGDALREQAKQAYIDEQIKADPDRPSAMTVTFQLRRGVTFSDGTPLTAEDIVYTWDLLNDPKIDAAATRNFFDNVERWEATGPHEVVFHMEEPHYLAFSMVGGFPILPKHFFSQYTAEDLNTKPGLLMGSGPYRMPDPASWAPGKPLELVRNERYWGTPPAFDRLIWREITNDVARLTMFRNGEIDLLAASAEQYNALLEDADVTARSQNYAYDPIPSGYRFIGWNQRRRGEPTMFADKRVRQAMTFLTPRQRIVEDVMLGYATVADGPFPDGTPQSAPEIEPRPYDVEKGRALLAEAGWQDRNGDGVIENAKGEPFRFKFTYPSGNAEYDRIMLYLKDSYASVGIAMELDPLEWSVFTERLDNRLFDACMLGWGGGAIESDIRQMFHTSQIEGRASNFTSYSNPRLDTVIDEARRTIDEDARMKLWQEAHRILYEDQPYTFMVRSQALRFMDDRIKNVVRISTGLNDRDEWFVPENEQKWTE